MDRGREGGREDGWKKRKVKGKRRRREGGREGIDGSIPYFEVFLLQDQPSQISRTGGYR